MDDGSVRYLLGGLREINADIPTDRRTLQSYIEEGGHAFQTKSGKECWFDRTKIDYLDSITDPDEKARLKLPILVYPGKSTDGGYWKVTGRLETAVVSRAIGRRDTGRDEIRLYFPDMACLSRKLRGLVYPVFLP